MNNLKPLSVLLIGLILTGCKQTELSELQEEILNKKINTVGFIPNPPEIEEFKRYNYKSSGLKSPFRNSISELKTEKRTLTEIKPDLEREKTELEEYPLGQYTMMGSIMSGSDNQLQAIMDNGMGKVFIVSVGDYIGKNNGVILEITDTYIKLEEIIPNGSYRWVKRPATISMIIKNWGILWNKQ